MEKRIVAVSEPTLAGNERKYLLDAIDSRWITRGKYCARLELGLADFLSVDHAFVCSSGTAALHLALVALGVGPGDRVLVPAFSYVATANAVRYCGADPVFVDVDPATWCISPALVAEKLRTESLAGRSIAGVVGVDVYRACAEIGLLRGVESHDGFFVISDSAESFGALGPEGIAAGTLADVGTFSFYGSKTITTGEGGAVVTEDPAIADRIRLYRGQGATETGEYFHSVVGFNYRMSDLAAAVGLAQLEEIDEIRARRAAVCRRYSAALAVENVVVQRTRDARPSDWIFGVLVPEPSPARERDVRRALSYLNDPGPGGGVAVRVRDALRDDGIETRPFFFPIPHLPPYRRDETLFSYPIATEIYSRGICLPTHANMIPEDVDYVVEKLCEAIR